MTIFWCGAEDIDFEGGVTSGQTTNSSYYDSMFSRSSLQFSSSGPYAYTKFTETPMTDYLWIGFRYNFVYTYYSNVLLMAMGIYHNSLQIALRAGPNSTDDDKLQLFVGGVAVGISVANVLSQTCKIDIEISNFSSEYAGTVKVYINAVEVISYTGILGSSVETGLSYVTFRVHSANHAYALSQVIIADEDTRLLLVKTLAPNAAGDTNQWSGAYTAIDEAVLDITDAIRTQEADKLFTTNLTGLPTGKWAVRAVKVVASSSPAKDGLGLQIGIKTNNEIHLGNSITPRWYHSNPIEKMFLVNPATLENFTLAEIEALQIAIKSVAV